MFNLVITNAPGPQSAMYIGGARMLEMYPVSPLLRNQTLSFGLTSYDGQVFYGLNADRDAMADVDVVTALGARIDGGVARCLLEKDTMRVYIPATIPMLRQARRRPAVRSRSARPRSR